MRIRCLLCILAITTLFTTVCSCQTSLKLKKETDMTPMTKMLAKGFSVNFHYAPKFEIEDEFLQQKLIPATNQIRSILTDKRFLQQIEETTFLHYYKPKGKTEYKTVDKKGKYIRKIIEESHLEVTLNTNFKMSKTTASALKKDSTITLNIYRIYGLKDDKLIRTLTHELTHLMGLHHPKSKESCDEHESKCRDKRDYASYEIAKMAQEFYKNNRLSLI